MMQLAPKRIRLSRVSISVFIFMVWVIYESSLVISSSAKRRYGISTRPTWKNLFLRGPIQKTFGWNRPSAKRISGETCDCCSSRVELIEPINGRNHEGHEVELYKDESVQQRFYETICSGAKEPCRFILQYLGSKSSCEQQHSYTYALVRKDNSTWGWALDHIRIRSGCTCKISVLPMPLLAGKNPRTVGRSLKRAKRKPLKGNKKNLGRNKRLQRWRRRRRKNVKRLLPRIIG